MLAAEFERQAQTLVAKGYPQLAGLSTQEFMAHLDPLRETAAGTGRSPDHLPFVIVVKSDLVEAAKAIEAVERHGEAGFSVLEPDDLGSFEPTPDVTLPAGSAYLMTGVDTGGDTLNVTPEDAVAVILGQGRTPLTIDEGIAVVTHHPEAVAKNGGFSLAASRCGDRRVTALWISKGRPKLGWCWAGNPHTWLGTASCALRAGP